MTVRVFENILAYQRGFSLIFVDKVWDPVALGATERTSDPGGPATRPLWGRKRGEWNSQTAPHTFSSPMSLVYNSITIINLYFK